MPEYIAVLTVILMLGMVVIRVRMMKRQGIEAFHFGKIDKKDFLIPPIAFFYFYTIFAHAFDLPLLSAQEFFTSVVVSWFGAFFCVGGLVLLLWSLISFGESFRVGIDLDQPDKLITNGAFAYSRNPIYLAFACILIGQFLIFSNTILLFYLIGAMWLFNRQVLREEDFLIQHYGDEFIEYSKRVRRYI